MPKKMPRRAGIIHDLKLTVESPLTGSLAQARHEHGSELQVGTWKVTCPRARHR